MKNVSGNYGAYNAFQEIQKGDLKSKLQHSQKQSINALKSSAKDTLILAGGAAATVGTTAVVAESKTAQKVIQKGVNALKNSNVTKEVMKCLGEVVDKSAPAIEKVITKFNSLPGAAKLVGAAGALLTAFALKANHDNKTFAAGRIAQETIDKNKLEKSLD